MFSFFSNVSNFKHGSKLQLSKRKTYIFLFFPSSELLKANLNDTNKQGTTLELSYDIEQ